MEILLFFCLLICIIFTMRFLGETIRQWDGYFYRKHTVIERINKHQQKVDILTSVFSTNMLLVWIFMMLSVINILFNITFNSLFFTLTPFIIIILCLIYHILCFIFEQKYDITVFYYNIIDYRKKQKVVTLDNDDEVTYIKTCENYFKHRKRIIPIVICFILYIMFI